MAQVMSELLGEINEEALLACGFEDAFMGIAFRANLPPIATYDYNKCIDVLVGQGLSQEEAHEHMEVNVIGSYMGDSTPVFVLLEEQPSDDPSDFIRKTMYGDQK